MSYYAQDLQKAMADLQRYVARGYPKNLIDIAEKRVRFIASFIINN